MKLVSACLIGISCRYDGQSKPDDRVMRLLKREVLIPVCPEQLGGLPTPREPSGIVGGEGKSVLSGRARVLNIRGEDVTQNFVQGAHQVLRIAKLLGINTAILKQRSPSCGCGQTQGLRHEGGRRLSCTIEGDGVTAALLRSEGLHLLSEEDL
ncbi:MAG: DUF523 domain-containing protein [Chloroflexi bacterium]|nr:MAG: DUF523 domain-containing protein [Chloroflexota bacterium]